MQGLGLCSKTEVSYKYIECVVEEYSVIRKRLKQRNNLATQINEVSENLYYRDYKKSIKPENKTYITINTMDLTNLNLDNVMAYIYHK